MKKEKSALIICDGLLPEFSFIRERLGKSQFVIACDGAANHLIQQYIEPNLIIGDMDSFIPSLGKPGMFIIKDPNQETNDLEKALLYALSEGFTHIEVLGALGKRIDHSLKNLSVLVQFNSKFDWIYIRDEFGISFIAASETIVQLKPGTLVSLVPLNGIVKGITTTGLAYPLSNEELEVGKRDGSSNTAVHEAVHIQKEFGELLLFIGLQRCEPKEIVIRNNR